MNIIFVSNSMPKAKTLSTLQVCMIALTIAIIPASILALILLPQTNNSKPHVKDFIPAQLQFSFNNPQKHLDAYAVQIGELQARIVLLDAQSQRLEKLAGAKLLANPNADTVPNSLPQSSANTAPSRTPGDTTTPSKSAVASKIIQSPSNANNNAAPNFQNSAQAQDLASPIRNSVMPNNPAAQDKISQSPIKLHLGGPLVRAASVTEADIQAQIAELMADIDVRTEQISNLEATILQQTVLKNLLPNRSPVRAAFNSSSFGWRYDPFNGNRAFHEGLDFTAVTGTPIYAAAGGIVAFSGHTNDYGNIVKLEHGAGLETRYAHASKLLVRHGQRVEKGQKIAEVGSTGRSTGPHLHYEIRLNGNALDPRKYLNAYR